jgi:hypothetical protein
MKAALLLVALLAPVPLAAQGLGDTAARERQKREERKTPAPAKVYTNQDLPAAPEDSADSVTPRDSRSPGPKGPATSADPSSPDSSGAPRDDEPTDPLERERQQRKLLEAEWSVRFANAREELARAEADSWREVVRTEFYQGIPVPMKIREQVQTEELKRARQALADLEEEFRRTGLPPGWARED